MSAGRFSRQARVIGWRDHQMQTTVVPAAANTIVISIEYDATGLAWARLTDHQALAWYIDNSQMPMPPRPSINGTLPRTAPDTRPILSPQWAEFVGGPAIFVPSMWRGSINNFFTWLATNNGAHRQLAKGFGISSGLYNAFDNWARRNPDLVLPDTVGTLEF
jgi:hypothetical protein